MQQDEQERPPTDEQLHRARSWQRMLDGVPYTDHRPEGRQGKRPKQGSYDHFNFRQPNG